MYSLLGGGARGGVTSDARKVEVDPSDPFSAIATSAQVGTEVELAPLKTPPKWFRRPCTANFGVRLNQVPHFTFLLSVWW